MTLHIYYVYKSELDSYGNLIEREISHVSKMKGET